VKPILCLCDSVFTSGGGAITNQLASSASNPHLSAVFLSGLTAAEPKTRLFGGDYVEYATVSTVAAYLFQQSAIAGMELSSESEVLAPIVWPTDQAVSVLWGLADNWIEQWEELRDQEVGLGYAYLQVRYENLHSSAAAQQAMSNPGAFQRVAQKKVDVGRATKLWRLATEEGFAVGATAPDRVLTMLGVQYDQVYSEKWQRARDAGLDLPEEPPTETADEVIAEAMTLVRGFVEANYQALWPSFLEAERVGQGRRSANPVGLRSDGTVPSKSADSRSGESESVPGLGEFRGSDESVLDLELAHDDLGQSGKDGTMIPSDLLDDISNHLEFLGFDCEMSDSMLLATHDTRLNIAFIGPTEEEDELYMRIGIGRSDESFGDKQFRAVNQINRDISGWFSVSFQDDGALLIHSIFPFYRYSKDSFNYVMGKWDAVENLIIASLDELD
jgi:hypothetical protein